MARYPSRRAIVAHAGDDTADHGSPDHAADHDTASRDHRGDQRLLTQPAVPGDCPSRLLSDRRTPAPDPEHHALPPLVNWGTQTANGSSTR